MVHRTQWQEGVRESQKRGRRRVGDFVPTSFGQPGPILLGAWALTPTRHSAAFLRSASHAMSSTFHTCVGPAPAPGPHWLAELYPSRASFALASADRLGAGQVGSHVGTGHLVAAFTEQAPGDGSGDMSLCTESQVMMPSTGHCPVQGQGVRERGLSHSL